MYKVYDISFVCGNKCEDVECYEDESGKGDIS